MNLFSQEPLKIFAGIAPDVVESIISQAPREAF